MPDIASLLPMLGLLLAIGAFAGVIAGLLGGRGRHRAGARVLLCFYIIGLRV